MFENLFYQEAGKLLAADFERKILPGAILLCGSEYSGKLTAALELARVLLCRANPAGKSDCDCPSCVRSRQMLNPNLLLLGPKSSRLEISALKNTFLQAAADNTSYCAESHRFFVVAVRKLLARFSEILWQKDTNATKIAVLVSEIADLLDEIDVARSLPESKKLEKIVSEIEKSCEKLENSYLYDSIPIAQIRNVEEWSSMMSDSCRVVILENAEKMQDSVRNALLKTLEEPPSNTFFILTTSNRGAILPTILSRVRLYSFSKRSADEEKEIIRRIFHTESESISLYFQRFLGVPEETLRDSAVRFLAAAVSGNFAESNAIVKNCASFEPRVLLKLFFSEAENLLRPLMKTAEGVSALKDINAEMREAWKNVTVFNQNPEAALDILLRRIFSVNRSHGGAVASTIRT